MSTVPGLDFSSLLFLFGTGLVVLDVFLLYLLGPMSLVGVGLLAIWVLSTIIELSSAHYLILFVGVFGTIHLGYTHGYALMTADDSLLDEACSMTSSIELVAAQNIPGEEMSDDEFQGILNAVFLDKPTPIRTDTVSEDVPDECYKAYQEMAA